MQWRDVEWLVYGRFSTTVPLGCISNAQSRERYGLLVWLFTCFAVPVHPDGYVSLSTTSLELACPEHCLSVHLYCSASLPICAALPACLCVCDRCSIASGTNNLCINLVASSVMSLCFARLKQSFGAVDALIGHVAHACSVLRARGVACLRRLK